MMLYTTGRPRLPQPPAPFPSPTPASTVSRSSTHPSTNKPSLSHQPRSAKSKSGSLAVAKPTTTNSLSRSSDSKYAERNEESSIAATLTPVQPRIPPPSNPSESYTDMGKRSISPSIPPITVDTLTPTPIPTSPVQIPKQKSRSRQFGAAHPVRQHNNTRRKGSQNVHSPESLSPSLAALLAVTDIPRPRQSQRKSRMSGKPLTVDALISNEKQLSEKELSWSLSRGSPMDMLLSPPESLDDDFLGSDCNCSFMTRTLSADSIPSLGDSFVTDVISSMDSPRSLSPSRRRMASPIRKSLEPVRSPPDSIDEHPLASEAADGDDLEFVTVQQPNVEEDATPFIPFKPLRAAFKSNLTASLRALRSAAKSFSSINFPSIPPDDFLTRSILTMDPEVPYADERRPPVTEEMPSAELRRYLNPTTRLSRETHTGTVPSPGTFAASIQMQTYKIQRLRPTQAAARNTYPSTSPQLPAAVSSQPLRTAGQDETPPLPIMRQREVRENPDFIRVAVMEMAMRRRGKLDNHKPGRARWALPPRKASTKHYEIGADGVPQRWIPITV